MCEVLSGCTGMIVLNISELLRYVRVDAQLTLPHRHHLRLLQSVQIAFADPPHLLPTQ